MWFEIFVQVLGFVALGIYVISVQFNRYSTVLILKTIGSLLFALQYGLLGAFPGLTLEIVGCIRNLIFCLNEKKNRSNKNAIVCFSIFTVITGIVSIVLAWDVSEIIWTNDKTIATIVMVAISVLAIIAKVFSTVAYGLTDTHLLRMLNLPSSFCWLIYNLTIFSLGAALSDSMNIVSVLIAEYRFRNDKKTSSTSQHIIDDTESAVKEQVE